MASEKRAPLRGWVEFPQYTRQRIPLFMVRDQLALHGLHVVTVADKAVLDAMAAVPEETLRNTCEQTEYGVDAARAELARRGVLK